VGKETPDADLFQDAPVVVADDVGAYVMSLPKGTVPAVQSGVARVGREVWMADMEQTLLSFGPFGVSVCEGPYAVFKRQWQNVFLIELTDHCLRGSRRSRFLLPKRQRRGASFEIPYTTIISVKLSPHPARLGLMQVLEVTYRDPQGGVRVKSIAAYNRWAEGALAILQRYVPQTS
jgi:hypothetical protein